jgi:hypothetical protein
VAAPPKHVLATPRLSQPHSPLLSSFPFIFWLILQSKKHMCQIKENGKQNKGNREHQRPRGEWGVCFGLRLTPQPSSAGGRPRLRTSHGVAGVADRQGRVGVPSVHQPSAGRSRGAWILAPGAALAFFVLRPIRKLDQALQPRASAQGRARRHNESSWI